ncbi:branched-chain amino acid ABC transporter substrate-binding protein [Bacteroidia bacterium]|nr:branched-chain amino acid ABC transporter substrate-binding protein [Bacteroidia bacterium]
MKLFKLLIIVITTVSLIACDDAPKSNKPVVKIGMILPLSGDFAAYGDATKRALEIFRDDIEKQNLANNYEFILEDGGTESQKASTLIRKMIFLDKINAVMDYISATAMVIAPIAEENQIIHISSVAAPEASVGNYNFRLISDFKDGAEMISRKLKSYGVQKIALVNQQSSSMSIIMAELKPVFAKYFDITGDYSFNAGEKDYGVIVQRLAREKPDYIILESMPPDSTLFVKSVRQHNINIPITGFQTIMMIPDLSVTEGWWDVDTAMPDSGFLDKYGNVGGTDNSYYADYVYTMLQILVNGFENAKTTDRSGFLEVTNGLNSPIGKLTISKDKNVNIPNVYKQVKNGIAVMIKE